MKVIPLLLAVISMCSCVPKTWMVGSVNDQKSPPKLAPVSDYVTTSIPGGPAAPVNPSAKKPVDHINPVNHTRSSNPTR